MISHYFIVAFRNLVRNKVFTIINMLGLAVGITVFLLIAEYIAYEWGANRFHRNFDYLYRVSVTHKDGNTNYYLAPGFAPVIKQRFSGIAQCIRVADGAGSGLVSITGDVTKNEAAIKTFSQESISYVDGDFLQVFSFPLVAGTPSLQQPKTMALSETLANRYFGTTGIIGRSVIVSNQFGKTSYTITAVIKNIPQQSDIRPDMLLSLSTLESRANRDGNDWADPGSLRSAYTCFYLQLKAGVDATLLADAITAFVKSRGSASKDDHVNLQPFSALHLAPSVHYPLQTYGSLLTVLVFAGVALLVLLVAWINYINLSAAQALKKATDERVKKVLGASKTQLVFQYLTETFLLTLTATILGFGIIELLQPAFNSFTGKQLSLQAVGYGVFWLVVGILIFAGALISGAYLAFALSSFQPVKAIRRKAGNIAAGVSFRKSLVVLQLAVSAVFIICTIAWYRQLPYIYTQHAGISYSRESANVYNGRHYCHCYCTGNGKPGL